MLRAIVENGDSDAEPSANGRGGGVSAFARLVVRGRWLVIVGWIAIAVVLTTVLPDVKSATTGSLGDLVANDADAIDAELRSVELFEFPVLSRTVIVQRDADGLSREAQGRVVSRAAKIGLQELPGVEGIAFALPITNDIGGGLALERATTALTYLFFPLEIGPVGRTGLAERLVARYIDQPSDGTVGVTGAVPARAEQVREISDALPLVELATILLVTLAVGLHFRSPGAALANVAAIALAYLISLHLIGGAGQAVGIAVPEEVEPVMVALLFGIVTDYTIFFVSRFRRKLIDGRGAHDAAETTAVELTPIILAAGISVAAGSASLAVAQLGFFQAFGPGMALAVLVALAVVLTFIPAVLAAAGELVLWPKRRRAGAPRPLRTRGRAGRARAALLELPTRRPLIVVVATVTPLLALAFGLSRLELANTLISGLPADSPTRSAFAEARQGFAAGAIAPLMVMVEGEDVSEQRAELRQLQRELDDRRGVAATVGPAQLRGPPVELGAVVSPTGDAVRYLMVLEPSPLGSRAIGLASALREDLEAILQRVGLEDAVASIAGDTAISEETVRKTEADLVRIVPVAALAVFIVLAIFLRALVAPLYLVASSLLALAASLGLTVLVFQDLLGYGELTFYVPFAGTVLLIALGSDYNVYLVGRVWAVAKEQPLRRAVAIAGSRASTAITAAGVVLALSFALLAIVPLRPFRELSFLLASGLLIDAFVVRSLLAPAMITIVGERSGWPGKSLRRNR